MRVFGQSSLGHSVHWVVAIGFQCACHSHVEAGLPPAAAGRRRSRGAARLGLARRQIPGARRLDDEESSSRSPAPSRLANSPETHPPPPARFDNYVQYACHRPTGSDQILLDPVRVAFRPKVIVGGPGAVNVVVQEGGRRGLGFRRVREARVTVCRTNVVPLAPTAMSEPRTKTPSFLPHNEMSEARCLSREPIPTASAPPQRSERSNISAP